MYARSGGGGWGGIFYRFLENVVLQEKSSLEDAPFPKLQESQIVLKISSVEYRSVGTEELT